MAELFLIALGLVLLLLLLDKLEHAETKLLVKTLKWTFISLLVLSGIYLTLVGRLLHVAAIGVLLTLLLKKEIHSWKHKKRPHPHLTEEEAAKILKIHLNASVEEIHQAYNKNKTKDPKKRALLLQARELLLKKYQ